MAVPTEKNLWEIAGRGRVGRPKVLHSHKQLWNAAVEYFKWCDNNPWLEEDYRGKDAEKVKIAKKIPYTLQGLCIYIGVSEAYFRQINIETTDDPEKFSTVLTRVKAIIRDQKFTGATAGFFNPGIISKDLGLAETINQNISDQRKEVGELFPDELEDED